MPENNKTYVCTIEMDECLVDKIKLSNYGFKLNLIVFSTFLSIFGIVVSTLGTLGGIAILVVGIDTLEYTWILLFIRRCNPPPDDILSRNVDPPQGQDK